MSYEWSVVWLEGELYLLSAELWQHDAGRSHPERTHQLVYDAMHMVEGQRVQDDIISTPGPLGDQTLNLQDKKNWLWPTGACECFHDPHIWSMGRSQKQAKAIVLKTFKAAMWINMNCLSSNGLNDAHERFFSCHCAVAWTWLLTTCSWAGACAHNHADLN